jgi:hypothetical protein
LHDDADDAKDRLKWKWTKGDATAQVELGDPTQSTDFRLCVFEETTGPPNLLLSAEVPASASLWSAAGGGGYKYADVSAGMDGMQAIVLRGGEAGFPKILVKGKGAALGDPPLPLSLSLTGIRVQLTNQSNGVCWESEFPLDRITADDERITTTVP